jgi:PKD repeat protein
LITLAATGCLLPSTRDFAGSSADGGTKEAPLPSFTASCVLRACTFDASGSTDPDGTIAAFAWTFGDGSTGDGKTTTHTYAADGVYTVKLTVTDDRAVTASTDRVVRVPSFLVRDTFTRTSSGGWGTADTGGTWTSASSLFTVAKGTGNVVVAAGTGPVNTLTSQALGDLDMSFTFTTDKPATGSGVYLGLDARIAVAVGEYRAKVRLSPSGSVTLALAWVSPTFVETVLSPEAVVPGIAYAPGTLVRTRFVVRGTNPTSLSAKAWSAGTTEPTDWLVKATDATPGLQAPGGIGVTSYLSGSATNAPLTVSWDDLEVALP